MTSSTRRRLSSLVGAIVEYTGDRAHAHAAELCNVLDGHGDTLCMKKSKPVSGNLTGNVSTFSFIVAVSSQKVKALCPVHLTKKTARKMSQ